MPTDLDITPEYLALGHITADLQADGSVRPGGTALYAALTAQALGCVTAIFTACAADVDLAWLPPGIAVHRQASAATTTFRNVYAGNQRQQQVTALAAPLNLAALPPAWRAAPLVHVGPVINELVLDAGLFSGARVGVTPQGWLRSWDEAGTVSADPQRLRGRDWRGVGVVVVSEEDVDGDAALLAELAAQVPITVLTAAERGATVWWQGQPTVVPAYPATVADPTGAGDVFAAALLVALGRGDAPAAATDWACAAASCAIEGLGATALPTAALIRARQRRGRD